MMNVSISSRMDRSNGHSPSSINIGRASDGFLDNGSCFATLLFEHSDGVWDIMT